MRQEEPRDPHQAFTPSNMMGLATMGVFGWAAVFWPFMRCRFGVRAFHANGLAAIVVMYLYGLFYPCPEAMLGLFGVWMLLIFVHRVEALAKGQHRYDYDDGDSWMANVLRPRSEFMAKALYEGIILFFAGVVLFNTVSEGLGTFVGLGGVPLFIKATLERAMFEAKMREAKNMRYRMRAYAEYMRNHP
jgi:hypothetical protein